MKLMAIIDYTEGDDPIRSPHGLSRLLDFASHLEGLVRDAGVTQLTPVIWECFAPRGYCVFEVESEDALEPLLERFGHKPRISTVHVRFLDELQILAREKLAEMAASGRSTAPLQRSEGAA